MTTPAQAPSGPDAPAPAHRPPAPAAPVLQPTIHPLNNHPEGTPVNDRIYRLVVAATRLPRLLRGQHLSAFGRDHLPLTGPLIIAGNHVSALDPFLIAQVLPPQRQVQFMTKKELFTPLLSIFIGGGGSFPVDRQTNDTAAIRNAIRILNRGGTVGIFPEGTRGGGEMQAGVGLIALRGKAPIVPVGLHLDGRAWIVRFGPPIAPGGSIKGLTAQVAEEIGRLSQPF
jgi:1-acyl-sn-glycerol-3-phosphate acyltransferase